VVREALAAQDSLAWNEAACDAIRLGMEEPGPGLHVYLSGRPGTGRFELVRRLAPTLRPRTPRRPDRLYVPEPDAEQRPTLLEVEPGVGRTLVAELEALPKRLDARATRALLARWDGPVRAWLERVLPLGAGGRRFLRANLISAGYSSDPPLVFEPLPTWANLFGTLEGDGPPDIDQIRAGSLLSSDGGWLAVRSEDLIHRDREWDELLRVLEHRQLEIRRPDDETTRVFRPQPIPVDLRVLLLGDEGDYRELFEHHRQFPSIFRIKATFDDRIPRTPEALGGHAAVARRLEHEGVLPIDDGGLAALFEEAVREAGDRRFVTSLFRWTGDLVRQADHHARRRNDTHIRAVDVHEAENAERSRLGVRDRWVREEAIEGKLLIDTEGGRVGVVNGLAVHDYGNLGKVCRISATVGPGSRGVVNVEREVSLSASSYDKGVFILSGYLSWRLGSVDAPAFTARLVFEQSYGGITGDSATCAETCAIVSALADLPIRQDLAVTGSMNQHGEVQAIGGVNEKIEGFFELCRARGLTGSQGVVLPRSNVDELMLREDVVEACRAKQFHVYAVATVEEALELLLGRRAGVTAEPDRFTRNSIFSAVKARLRDWESPRRARRPPQPRPQPVRIRKVS
jgi:predicted ATP-dependent protease